MQGTVTAVTSSSVTVRASTRSTATYAVASDTQVLRDGAEVAVTALQAGDAVLVHVLSGGTAERVLAGTLPGRQGTQVDPGTSGGLPET